MPMACGRLFKHQTSAANTYTDFPCNIVEA
jgi:hypothetical protein